MANKIPLKVILTEGDTSALSEFNPGDTVGIEFGGTGAATLTEAKDNLGISAIESELADKQIRKISLLILTIRITLI